MPADKNCVPFSGEKETQFFYIFTGMTGIHAGIIDYQRMGTRIIWQIVILGQEEQPETVFLSFFNQIVVRKFRIYFQKEVKSGVLF